MATGPEQGHGDVLESLCIGAKTRLDQPLDIARTSKDGVDLDTAVGGTRARWAWSELGRSQKEVLSWWS